MTEQNEQVDLLAAQDEQKQEKSSIEPQQQKNQSKGSESQNQRLVSTSVKERSMNRVQEQEDIIDPVKELIDNSNPLPILAVLDHFQLDEEIQPGKPLINFLCNKFLPLDQIMKNRKVELKADSSGKTPLHYAVQADDVKSAHWCLQNGNPNVRDQGKYSPIMVAVKNGYRRCFLLLLQYKHFDECAAHVAAAYNRVWELQIMNTFKYKFLDAKDSAQRTPIDVAVQSYSYQAAQYLASISQQTLNIDKLENRTDSKAIIRRIKKSISSKSIVHRKLIPIVKIMFTFGVLLYATQTSVPLLPYSSTYLYCFIILLASYLGMIMLNCISNVKFKDSLSLLRLLRAPDFPTLEQVCPKCIHYSSPDFDHCDECGCCVRRFHYHDWICVNSSNEALWFLVELFWLLLAIKIFGHFAEDMRIVTKDWLPFFMEPFRLVVYHIKSQQWVQAGTVFVCTVSIIHSFFYLLEIFGIMFMGRTYQQVNHTERYEHLYRVVKLRDGTLRNKEIRVFQDGFFIGLLKGIRNIIRFFVC